MVEGPEVCVKTWQVIKVVKKCVCVNFHLLPSLAPYSSSNHFILCRKVHVRKMMILICRVFAGDVGQEALWC